MDGKEFYKYAKACNDRKITIYPKCSNTGKYKIIINRNGHEKEGEEYYENEAHVKQIEIKKGDLVWAEIYSNVAIDGQTREWFVNKIQKINT